jgi:hypothetical protein
MLWLVENRDRWGYSLHIVRAGTKAEALLVACDRDDVDNPRIDITELPSEGPVAVLWTQDESPDGVDFDR